jgi:hypothetical protein
MRLSDEIRESSCELFTLDSDPPRLFRRGNDNEITVATHMDDLFALRETERRIFS